MGGFVITIAYARILYQLGSYTDTAYVLFPDTHRAPCSAPQKARSINIKRCFQFTMNDIGKNTS